MGCTECYVDTTTRAHNDWPLLPVYDCKILFVAVQFNPIQYSCASISGEALAPPITR